MSPHEYLLLLGNNIRDLREKAGVSKEALGTYCKIDPLYISQVERGQCRITVLQLATIAQALKVKPAVLLQEDD